MVSIKYDYQVVVDWEINPRSWGGRPRDVITGLSRLEAEEIAENYRQCELVIKVQIRKVQDERR